MAFQTEYNFILPRGYLDQDGVLHKEGVMRLANAADLAYLQDLYQRINTMDVPVYRAVCPHCGKEIQVPINFMEADQ